MIGILGGMGPLATIDLMRKIVLLTGAVVDQEHIPVITYSDPTVPDRRAAVLDANNCSPLPMLLVGVRALEVAGATSIIIACHTAHHWISALSDAIKIPIIDIADAVCSSLNRTLAPGCKVAILATQATLISGFYQRKLIEHGFIPIFLTAEQTYALTEKAITHVKRGEIDEARPYINMSIDIVQSMGADIALLACTELPLLISNTDKPPLPLLDATECLAQAAINWHLEKNRRMNNCSEF